MKIALAQLSMFSAFRPIEDYPNQQVLSEILKAMDLAGGREERVAGAELQALALDKEPTSARGHNIKLVAGVGLLQVGSLGSVYLQRQRAMAEEFGIKLSIARGDGIL